MTQAAQQQDLEFLRGQLRLAREREDEALARMSDMDYRWTLDVLVRAQTEAMLLAKAVEGGDVDDAAKVAASLIRTALGGGHSTDPFDNEIARQKAQAALEVLRVLSATVVSLERIGELMVR